MRVVHTSSKKKQAVLLFVGAAAVTATLQTIRLEANLESRITVEDLGSCTATYPYSYNWGAKQEKWFTCRENNAADRHAYYVLPNGSVYKRKPYTQKQSLDGWLIDTVDAEYYYDIPELVFTLNTGGLNNVVRSRKTLGNQKTFDLYSATNTQTHTVMQERLFGAARTRVIEPERTTLSRQKYSSLQGLQGWQLTHLPGATNSGLRNEKWFFSEANKRWYFLPKTESWLYEWDGRTKNPLRGTKVLFLGKEYYDTPGVLEVESASGVPASETLHRARGYADCTTERTRTALQHRFYDRKKRTYLCTWNVFESCTAGKKGAYRRTTETLPCNSYNPKNTNPYSY